MVANDVGETGGGGTVGEIGGAEEGVGDSEEGDCEDVAERMLIGRDESCRQRRRRRRHCLVLLHC